MIKSTQVKRILLKLSGEALMGSEPFGIDPVLIKQFAEEIKAIAQTGVQVGLVIGGGNIFRGAGLAQSGIDRVTGDHMGMLATVMNSLAMQDSLNRLQASAIVMSALTMNQVCDQYTRRKALENLEQGHIVIFAAGTGNPYFTTDSAASLRAIEINADMMIKATKVDGVYSDDPVLVPDAQRYAQLSYDDVISRQLKVMDTTATVLCRDNKMPLRVMNIFNSGDLLKIVQGDTSIGTIVQ